MCVPVNRLNFRKFPNWIIIISELALSPAAGLLPLPSNKPYFPQQKLGFLIDAPRIEL